MKTFTSAQIRNVALVGHGGVGKTTLAEALLADAGVTTRIGRVEDGSTVTDTEPEEIRRHLSVSTALAAFESHGCKLNLLDCPGYADFFAEVQAGLALADLAVIVVSAVEGVQVQTEIAWEAAAALGLPRMIFINKLDRERASFDRTLDQLRATFGAGVAPLELPLGEEGEFRGVIDLLSDKAYIYGSDGVGREEAVPEELANTEHMVHDALVEGIVVADDNLMERYLEGDNPSFDELEKTLALGVADATVFPVVCGSATKRVGVDRLAQFLTEIAPSPVNRPPLRVTAGDTEAEIPCDPNGETLAVIGKTIADPFVGRVSLLRVWSGTIKPDTVLTNTRSRAEERLHGLFTLRGKEHEPVTDVPAGDLVAVPKLSDSATGDTLAPKGQPVRAAVPRLAPPALWVAIKPKSQGDEDKLMTSLHRLQEEDPTLVVERKEETHQTLLGGAGETHLAVITERLTRKFGVEVVTEDVAVAYRETITQSATAEGKHKKQSGGHGQFGVCTITIAPLGRGEGFRFVDKIVGGAIPRQFIPAVERGIQEAMAHGGPNGHPVVDLEVTLTDGKYHTVDSSEMSFKMAGALALREAMANAGVVVLEPLSRLQVTAPTGSQGDVMGDLNARRGRVQETDTSPDGARATITALVPTAELRRYAIDLRSLTGGRGSFTVEHDHYDVAPPNVAAAAAKPKEH
ncbi:MAG TPA: elongation factor G [Acidimicrobiales bacterium]|nr:elongation factor G [Acidimicrobiales bacterium]